MEKVPN